MVNDLKLEHRSIQKLLQIPVPSLLFCLIMRSTLLKYILLHFSGHILHRPNYQQSFLTKPNYIDYSELDSTITDSDYVYMDINTPI